MAGQASFRRRETLDELERKALDELERKALGRVAELKGRLGDGPTVDKRCEAAVLRAARERSERIAQVLRNSVAQKQLADDREQARHRPLRGPQGRRIGSGSFA